MTRISHLASLSIAASAALLAACSPGGEPGGNGAAANEVATDKGGPGSAMAGVPQSFNIKGSDGALLGTVTVSEDPSGLMMNVSAVGMPAGVHGIHLHEKGLCEGPKFESAGAHWNPGQKQHGRDNPAGPHAGDLANLTVLPDSTAKSSIPVGGAMLASGAAMVRDADGTALVIHAQRDDYRTDPSGNSGDRIACAVIAAPK